MKYIIVIFAVFVKIVVCTNLFATTYYVSSSGSNSNTGMSETQPFQVVQYAIDQMKDGDELIVLDGFYTGVLKLKSGITIKAKNPREVVFSGVEKFEATFIKHSGSIYKAKVSREVKQLFYNNEPMIWAQWPNITWAENWEHDKKWARATSGTGPGVLTSGGFDSINNLNLTGAYCFIRYGKGNSCYSRLIESFDGTILHWNDDNFYSSKYTGEDGPKASPEIFATMKESHHNHPINSKFFLAGALDLLDAPGEWFVKDNYLYLYPLDGTDPNEADILTKTIDYCIHEEETISNVKIEGIDFIAYSVSLTNALNSNISFTDVHFKYLSADLLFIDRVQGNDIDKPISVSGTAIHFEKCLFAGAQNSALKLTGSDLHVNNCVFMENNRHANFECRSLLVFPEGHYQFTHNTFFNNSSDAVRIVPDLSKMQSLHPEFSYNHVLNQGLYNTDVSGLYFPSKSQRYAEVHHNWFHNVKGNAVRLDLAGKELNVHHNVFWLTKRAMSIEGYGKFNVYNNTAVYNEVPADLIRNVLNHSGVTEASLDLSFPPIDDWIVLNNLIEYFQDRVGPREKITHNEQKELGLLHPERDSSWLIPIVDRGSMQGNMTGERREVFKNGDLSGLNLIPIDSSVLGGVEPSDTLRAEEVCCLNAYRGAYDVNGEYWHPGSSWMPNGLDVATTMAEAESFAQEFSTVSVLPQIVSDTIITDTIEFTSYQVTLMVRDEVTGESISGAAVVLGDTHAETDSSGSVSMTGIEYSFYQLSASAADYDPKLAYEVEIYSDTTLVISLVHNYFKTYINLVDRTTGDPVNRAVISSDIETMVSNSSGEVTMEKLLPGWWKYSVAHDDYFSLTDSVLVSSDTIMLIMLTNRQASIVFLVSDENGPVSEVPVTVNDWSIHSNSEGEVLFHNFLAREEYAYSIDYDGYRSVNDSFFLEVDTVISISLVPLAVATGKSQAVSVYPNPAAGAIYVELSEDQSEIRLLGLDGMSIHVQQVYYGVNRIDLSDIKPGIYCLQIVSEQVSRVFRIVIS